MQPNQLWVPIFFITACAFCICLIAILYFRDRKQKQDLIRQLVESGQASDPDAITQWVQATQRPQTDLWRALSDMGLGLGFVSAGLILQLSDGAKSLSIWPAALGAIILFQGGARMLAVYLETRSTRNSSSDTETD